jgi:2'-hydroxyisoflavone reductase
MMKILLLGGTLYAGRHLVEIALQRGFEVTLFHRGETNPELFPTVERLHGDRGSDLSALVGGRWDAVIDTSGYLPQVVRASAELLAEAVDHYTFISTISVYADTSHQGITETDPVEELDGSITEEVNGKTYGPLKALCELEAEAALPGRILTVRTGLIVGPYDPSDRFTYWPYRVAQGGEVLAPEKPASPVQIIDARDLAAWILDMVSARHTGVYNATGPAVPLSLGAVLEASREVSGSDARVTWVEGDFLLAQEVAPWMDLPLWLSGEAYAGFFGVDVRKAITHGLTFRPITETAADTLAWAKTRPADYEWQAGLTRERERALLATWHAANRS